MGVGGNASDNPLARSASSTEYVGYVIISTIFFLIFNKISFFPTKRNCSVNQKVCFLLTRSNFVSIKATVCICIK